MRLLLLLVLALFAIVTAKDSLKCFNGGTKKKDIDDTDCKKEEKYCVKTRNWKTDDGTNQHSCGNAATCPREGCRKDGDKEICCCKKKKCNGATSILTLGSAIVSLLWAFIL